MAEILSTVPTVIRAGDTVKWKKSFPDYPSSEWQLGYVIYNASNRYEVSATAQADGSFLIEISATSSSGFASGEYSWIARVTKGTETYTIDAGTIEILPNPTVATDERSHIKKVLDAIQRVIEGRATRADLDYTIGDKRVRSMTVEELYTAWRKYKLMYEQELQAERLRKGLGTNRIVRVRFV